MTTPEADPRITREQAKAAVQRENAAAASALRAQEALAQIEIDKAKALAKAEIDRTKVQSKVEVSETRRTGKTKRKTDQAKRRSAWINACVDYARHNTVAVFCGVVYGSAVTGAVYGQVTVGWFLAVGIVVAIALEGTGLSMALTALELRLQGERAIVPRVLTWVATAIAASINLFGHALADGAGVKEQTIGYALAALSVIGITVFEVRSGAKHRQALRAKGMLRHPKPSLGLDYRIRNRSAARWADRAMAADTSIRTRDEAIVAGRRLRDAAEDAKRRKAAAKLARKAVLKAAKAGRPREARVLLERVAYREWAADMAALEGLAAAWAVEFRPAIETSAPAAEVAPAGAATTPGAVSVPSAAAPGRAPAAASPAAGPLPETIGAALEETANSGRSADSAAPGTDRSVDRAAQPTVDREETGQPVPSPAATDRSIETGQRTATRTAPETTNVRSIETGSDRQLRTLRKKFPDRIPTATDVMSTLGMSSKGQAVKLRKVIEIERSGGQGAAQ